MGMKYNKDGWPEFDEPIAFRKETAMKTLEQALLDKILYIGNEIPEGVANDKRAKFVILGNPQELIDEVTTNQKLA